MSRTNLKRYLMLLGAIGLVAIAGGSSGTFASFNAEVTNTGNTFATGTLVLNDTDGTNTCTSAGGTGNTNNLSTNGCSTLFTVSNPVPPTASLTTALSDSSPTTTLSFTGTSALTGGTINAGDTLTVTSGANSDTFVATATVAPGATSVAVTSKTANFAFPVGSTVDDSATAYADLTLTNAGTLDASDITATMPSCTPSTTEGSGTLTSALASGTSYTSIPLTGFTGSFKVGDPVVVTTSGHAQTFITATAASNGDTSVTVIGQVANANYPIGATVSGPTFSGTSICDALKLSIIETDSGFDTGSPTAAQGCAFGVALVTYGFGCDLNSGTALTTFAGTSHRLTLFSGGGSTSPANVGTNLSAGASRYFVIAVSEPGGVDNTLQNQTATFDLRWHIDQA